MASRDTNHPTDPPGARDGADDGPAPGGTAAGGGGTGGVAEDELADLFLDVQRGHDSESELRYAEEIIEGQAAAMDNGSMTIELDPAALRDVLAGEADVASDDPGTSEMPDEPAMAPAVLARIANVMASPSQTIELSAEEAELLSDLSLASDELSSGWEEAAGDPDEPAPALEAQRTPPPPPPARSTSPRAATTPPVDESASSEAAHRTSPGFTRPSSRGAAAARPGTRGTNPLLPRLGTAQTQPSLARQTITGAPVIGVGAGAGTAGDGAAGERHDPPSKAPPPPARTANPPRSAERRSTMGPTAPVLTPAHGVPLPLTAGEPSEPRPVVIARADVTSLGDHNVFRREAQLLARGREWQKLAAITSAVIDHAPWAAIPETRTALLVDLARVHRDRLGDRRGAESAFRRLVQVDPTNEEALGFLSSLYESRGEWRAIYDLYSAAVEPTWDPNQRLVWTQRSAAIALDRLGSTEMAIDAWERLDRLGDGTDETFHALTEMYRRARRWDRLADFLSRRAAQLGGSERLAALREVAEAHLSGLRDHRRAGEVLDAILAERPGDVLALFSQVRVLARRGDWPAVSALADLPLEGGPPAVVVDFRRAVAQALWSADQRDEAMEAWERVLEIAPDDADALAAKERFLAAQPGRAGELADFLVRRADRVATDDERALLLARAAELVELDLDDARRAVVLWEQRAGLSVGQLESRRALERLYDRLGDLQGVARSLEGQLALTRNPTARVELLRRLGDHAAHRMDDDDRAEACWNEANAIAPDDRATQDELLALHRRRGDFEALDRALMARAYRTTDRPPLLALLRAAAENIEDNVRDPRRAQAAWNRVLDLAPTDEKALAAAVSHQRALGDRRLIIGVLEARLRAESDPDARRKLALEVARLWEEEGVPAAARAAYERALRWDPTDEESLAALERLPGANDGGHGVVMGALEVAAWTHGAGGDAAAQARCLERALALGEREALAAFHGRRRLLWLSPDDPAALTETEKAAAAAGAFGELAEVQRALAAERADGPPRADRMRVLAGILAEQLADPVRAFVVLQSIGRPPIAEEALLELKRLAKATGRFEDLLALLDVATGAEQPAARRQRALRERIALLESEVGDAARALADCARLLRIEPTDEAALRDARRLAAARGLWRPLDALLAELSDRAPSLAQRVAILQERAALHAERLDDRASALRLALTAYRLDPRAQALDDLLARAESLDAWDRVLPVAEACARARAHEGEPRTEAKALGRLAALHASHRRDPDRAFELYAEAFLLCHDDPALDGELARLAVATGRVPSLVSTLRAGAARSEDTGRKLTLLRQVAQLASDQLGDRLVTVDAHRAIAQLVPAALPSLDVLIEQHRTAGEWRELRERLQQWIEHAPREDAARRVARWLEVARLSRDRLGDPESALVAAERVLDVDPAQAEALELVQSLGGRGAEPRFELRRLRIELLRATEPARRADILLACARIEGTQLDDTESALATLRTLAAESGAGGPAFEPLSALLRQRGEWAALADLLEARAEAVSDGAERAAALVAAIDVCEQRLTQAPFERREALLRRLLALRPEDLGTRRRLLALYRETGRNEDLATALRDALAAPGLDQEEQRALSRERYRVVALALHHEEEAAALFAAGHLFDDAEGELARARAALGAGDFATWLEARHAGVRRLPAAHGALVLCHLAEACDDTVGYQVRTAGLYREARALDPQNLLAMEALKAIGRRARNWRASAALLPEPDEARLTQQERAHRLLALGRAAMAEPAADRARAGEMLLRAVAVDPDAYPAWDALAELRAGGGDVAGALDARTASLAAYERSVAPSSDEATEHVARIEALAAAERVAGQGQRAAKLSLQAHRLRPAYPTSALSVADEYLASGQLDEAHALYDRVLRGDEQTADRERLHALYRRGTLAARLGRGVEAIADLEAACALEPLHAGVLRGLAEALDETGRVGAAATHYLQALLVEPDGLERSKLYARLGRLLEDQLGAAGEAGVCYDLSLATAPDGELGDGEVLSRALAHYRRQGRPERALAVIDRILQSLDDPREQAALWSERGAILAGTDDEERAVEAFDMALSYEPGNRGALAGLSRILERRGDWEQLAQIFEARTESGVPEERAEAHRALARIALAQLGNRERALRHLNAAVELAPTRDDYEQLVALHGDDPAAQDARLQALSGLLSLGGPYMPRLIELGRRFMAAGDRRWAWCLLSPLMNSTLPEPQLKAMVLELRKEFEKSDNAAVLSPATGDRVRPPGLPRELAAIMAELDRAVTLGRATLAEAGASGIGKLDERTTVGKTFAAMATRLGVEAGAQLVRAQELPEPLVVLDGDRAQVVVRAELLQLLSTAEVAFLFAFAVELTRPGTRLLASLRSDERKLLDPALRAACALGPTPAGGERLVERITAAVPEEQRGEWADRLRALPAAEVGADLYGLLLERARRVALVAAADLRFAARVITRLDDTLPKLQTVGRIDDLDEFIHNAAPVRSLVAFATSPLFGRLLHGE